MFHRERLIVLEVSYVSSRLCKIFSVFSNAQARNIDTRRNHVLVTFDICDTVVESFSMNVLLNCIS